MWPQKMSNPTDVNTSEDAFLMAQMILNQTAKLIHTGRDLRSRDRLDLKDKLYQLMDQYWKYRVLAVGIQAKSKL